MSQKTLKYVKGSKTSTDPVTLCHECAQYLEATNVEVGSEVYNVAWPSFIWHILINERLHFTLGSKLWQFIPLLWRHWWIDAIQVMFPLIFGAVSTFIPPSIFVDRTIDYENMMEDIKSLELSRLRDTTNKYLIPDILCPWGQSEYIHDCGFINIDAIYQRYMPQCVLKMISSHTKVMSKVYSARDDFIRFNNSYDHLLYNPRWKIRPTIIFIKGKGPFVCTSRHLDGGIKKDYLDM